MQHLLLTLRQLAEKLDVDSAMAIRAMLAMGFASYRDFQQYLYELAVSQKATLDTMRAAETAGSTLAAHIRATIVQTIRNLQGLD